MSSNNNRLHRPLGSKLVQAAMGAQSQPNQMAAMVPMDGREFPVLLDPSGRLDTQTMMLMSWAFLARKGSAEHAELLKTFGTVVRDRHGKPYWPIQVDATEMEVVEDAPKLESNILLPAGA